MRYPDITTLPARYAAWTRRQCSALGCGHIVLGTAVLAVIAAAVIWTYRTLVIEAVAWTLAAGLAAAILGGGIALALRRSARLCALMVTDHETELTFTEPVAPAPWPAPRRESCACGHTAAMRVSFDELPGFIPMCSLCFADYAETHPGSEWNQRELPGQLPELTEDAGAYPVRRHHCQPPASWPSGERQDAGAEPDHRAGTDPVLAAEFAAVIADPGPSWPVSGPEGWTRSHP